MNNQLLNYVTEKIQKENHPEDDAKYYHWHQCKELLTIVFDMDTISSGEVQCEFLYNQISLRLKSGQILLKGNLEKPIIEDASKWYIQNGK